MSTEKSTEDARVRHWLFTLNNPKRTHTQLLRKFKKLGKKLRYIVFQKEKGADGTEHYQGYVEFHVPYRFTQVKLLMDRAHWEPRRGTRDQARDYCMKADTREVGPWEFGEWNSKGQGHRTDLEEVAKYCNGKTALAVYNLYPGTFMKYTRGIEKITFMTRPRRTEAPIVELYYGPTGTGKTRKCYEDNPLDSMYRKAPQTTWFDGYMGQDVLLLDDFSGASSKFTLSYLLQLLDRYPIDVEVKGSYHPLLATRIIITTNNHPRKWYRYADREEQYKALARRIDQVLWFKAYGDEPMILSKSSFFDDWNEYCDEELTFVEVTQEEDLPDGGEYDMFSPPGQAQDELSQHELCSIFRKKKRELSWIGSQEVIDLTSDSDDDTNDELMFEDTQKTYSHLKKQIP